MYLQKVYKQINLGEKKYFCWHLERHWRKEQDLEQDPDPDPYQNVADPQHWFFETFSYQDAREIC